jgi:hypothetical protein
METSEVPPIVHEVLRSPGHSLDSETCTFMESRLAYQLSQTREQPKNLPVVQTNLKVGQPGDRYEREADYVADEVMQIPGLIATFGLRQSVDYDFRRVRVHTDTEAAESAQALNARAYTVGTHIVFGTGQYAPGTLWGKRLLAHELTHVVQEMGEVRSYVIRRANLYSHGFPPYNTETEEIDALRGGRWQPTRRDFASTAGGIGLGITSFGQLLGWINQQSQRSITNLNLIGHSNQNQFAFSGQVIFTTGGVSLNVGSALTQENLTAYSSQITNLNLRNRFAPGANITLYSCYTGNEPEFLQQIANTFRVCTRGFTSALHWCLTWQQSGDTRTIREDVRGQVTTGTCPGEIGLSHLSPDVQQCPQ